MKKDFSPAFCSALDNKNEHLITTINKNCNLGYAYAANNSYYGNITIASKTVFEYYLFIRDFFIKNSKKPNYVFIYDFGCGIGNVLELFSLLFKNDDTLAPAQKQICLFGIERIRAYNNVAIPTLKDLTPYVSLYTGDFNTDPSALEHYYHFVEKVEKAKETGIVASIVFVNRPIRDLVQERALEKHVITLAPVGTFLCFPMGAQSSPFKGVKRESNILLRKTHRYVQYK